MTNFFIRRPIVAIAIAILTVTIGVITIVTLAAAVNQQQGTCQVMVIDADNRVQLRTLEVGPRVGTLWVITSSLKPGERVVVPLAGKAKEGELVNPTSYKEKEER
jgi:membrane fusion protein (multidrug efflux system)